MRYKKICSAFISSVYESLLDERAEVINGLLSRGIFPIGMEYFTASVDKNFKDIEEHIEDSDFFILILGKSYGSCDEYGVSWTEREYEYAKLKKKPVLAIICDELAALRKNRDKATEDERKQLAFADKVPFARAVGPDLSILKIVNQYFTRELIENSLGWVREHSKYRRARERLEGDWYHVHLSPDDDRYVRTGTIRIQQAFDAGRDGLRFDGKNYSIRYRKDTGAISENILKYTHWTGTYDLDKDGKIFGIFQAKREFSGAFHEVRVEKGIRRGIHDFSIDFSEEKIDFFSGEFHDEAPSPKFGTIYVFRTREARDEFLTENFIEILENNQ